VQVELDQMNVNNEITVDITAQYHDWDALSGTTVCLMEREEGELRVGVFVSNGLFIMLTCSPPTKDTKTGDMDEQEDKV